MNIRLIIILSLAILVIAEKSKPTKKIRDKLRDLEWKAAKDVVTVVNTTNQIIFGLPLGTELKLDRKTKLHKPPKLFEGFTADDRILLTWTNKLTRNVYCKVGPGNLTDSTFTYDYYWHTWCRDSDGENLCCNNRVCDCNALGYDCECKTKGT